VTHLNFFEKIDLPETAVSPITGLPKEVFIGSGPIKGSLPGFIFSCFWLVPAWILEVNALYMVSFILIGLRLGALIHYRQSYPDFIQMLSVSKPILASLSDSQANGEYYWDITAIDASSGLKTVWSTYRVTGFNVAAFEKPKAVEVYLYETKDFRVVILEGLAQFTVLDLSMPKRIENPEELHL
jgi:hypothetical protein